MMYVLLAWRDGRPLGTPIECGDTPGMIFETFEEAYGRAEEYEAKYKEETAIYKLVGPVEGEMVNLLAEQESKTSCPTCRRRTTKEDTGELWCGLHDCEPRTNCPYYSPDAGTMLQLQTKGE